MKLAANRKNITTHAELLLGDNYSPERAEALVRECTQGFVRKPGHVSHSRAAHLERIDSILGNHGVEGILLGKGGEDLSGTCSMQGVELDCQYSNTGDTYAPTVLYVNGRLCIGDWGSLVERL
ncbi:MAG: hypothetical protein FJ187_09540 [Gammaproteobacteria bacterium]|nr:hypothetical protein [Gammaproteobacteria bacterium]